MNTDFVELEILFEASVKDLWMAWTDPVLILKWFGSEPDTQGLRANLDVHPGGCYEISFRDSSGTSHTCRGIYAEVRKFQKLIFSWEWKSEPGVESLVTLLFLPEGRFTRLKFKHIKLGNESKHGYQLGWQGAFSRLANVLKMNETDQ